jgi:homoserine kinase
MEDRLHQSFRSPLIPGLKKVLAAAKLAGARGVTLSGAGPSVIAFADSNFELIARVMSETFQQNGIKSRVMVLKPSPIGARALEVR